MKGSNSVILAFLLSLLLTGCSSIAEKKLLGEWQSRGPNPVRISITQTRVYTSDGSYEWYTETMSNGDTYRNSWKVESGNILAFYKGSIWDNPIGGDHRKFGCDYHLHYQIIELTADRLVIQFHDGIQEFQRIK